MELVFILLSFALISHAFGSVEQVIPQGHMKPFGAHMDPLPLEETEDIPDARTFFEKYVLPMRPIVFRNAAKKFGAFSKWTEEYLVKSYGDLEVRLENKLEKEGYTPTGAKGVGRDTLKDFFRTFQNSEKYIVSELPSPMYQDMMALPCMSCGPIRNRMVEIDLWLSSGASQSILHKDAFNTMNCLINGTKDWKIVLYKYEKDIYKAYEDGDPGGGYSKINVRSVDMVKYPNIATIPYYNITVHGGDCLYLPKSTYHQVNSLPGFNLAVTILFSRFDFDKPKNFKDCNDTTEKFTPLADFDIDWQYPGKGYMTMGYSELFDTKRSLLQSAKSGKMKAKHVIGMLQTHTDLFTGEQIDEAYIEKLFGVKKGETITKGHVARMTKAKLRKIGVAMQGLFPSNTYDYEFYKISPNDIARLIAVLVKRDGVLKKESFIDAYVSKLYGTRVYGKMCFTLLAGRSSAEEISREDILKNYIDAVNRYIGDDGIEEYDPNSKHGDKEDRGEAYIFVKKDLGGQEIDDPFLKKLRGITYEMMGGGAPEDEEEENGEEDGKEGDEEMEEEKESEGDEEPEKRSSEDAGQAEDEKEAGNNPKDEL